MCNLSSHLCAFCVSACPAGSYGKDCAKVCVCSGGGQCHPVTGRCNCTSGRTGRTCREGTNPLCVMFNPSVFCSSSCFCLFITDALTHLSPYANRKRMIIWQAPPFFNPLELHHVHDSHCLLWLTNSLHFLNVGNVIHEPNFQTIRLLIVCTYHSFQHSKREAGLSKSSLWCVFAFCLSLQ